MGMRNNKTINYSPENLFVASGQEEEKTPHEWDDMPEFNQPEAEAWKMINVRFRNEEDLLEFKNFGQKSAEEVCESLQKNFGIVLAKTNN